MVYSVKHTLDYSFMKDFLADRRFAVLKQGLYPYPYQCSAILSIPIRRNDCDPCNIEREVLGRE